MEPCIFVDVNWFCMRPQPAVPPLPPLPPLSAVEGLLWCKSRLTPRSTKARRLSATAEVCCSNFPSRESGFPSLQLEGTGEPGSSRPRACWLTRRLSIDFLAAQKGDASYKKTCLITIWLTDPICEKSPALQSPRGHFGDGRGPRTANRCGGRRIALIAASSATTPWLRQLHLGPPPLLFPVAGMARRFFVPALRGY